MDKKAHCEELIAFHLWREKHISELLRTVDTEYFSKQLSGSFGSLFIVLKHLVWAEKVWLGRFRNNEVAAAMKDQDVEGLLTAWREVSNKWAEAIATTPTEDFDANIRYYNSTGKEYNNSLFEIVTHLIDHSTYHIGQMMNTLRAFGIEPVSTNYIHFLRAKNS